MLKSFVDGASVNFVHLLDRPGAVAKNVTIGPLAEIEPAALQFRCSALTN